MNGCDELIIVELMETHKLNMILDKNEGGEYIDPDWELLKAIETVLQYYLDGERYESWIQKIALDKLSLIGQLNGEYGEPQTENDS